MIVTPEAEHDRAQAQAFYEQRCEGLGEDFIQAVGKALLQIERLPETHSLIHREVRRTLTRRYPFAIYYRIENDEPVNLAVIHRHRDPKDWKSRI